ncbi:hypothetical protein JGS39_00240 [Streptomyces sp. P01-B04]|uniref:hypothetical protein n=1 Tax=Streptomyces poriferorum TaxID=2798799 RepID=UPI001C5F3D71|nr:hypothetical protein [Streptomyces poriferorum]MBW5247468.1 hypothetical protein [Streptomyces poriferorum]MBW5255477.1 hypothetical protein [Streptomyces poriferorum]
MSTDSVSLGKQLWRGLGLAVRDAAKEGVLATYRNEYDLGFDEAAQICMGVLSDATDELLAKMKSGNLSKQEQALYARLTELTSEMEGRLRSACAAEPTRAALPPPSGTPPRKPNQLS